MAERKSSESQLLRGGFHEQQVLWLFNKVDFDAAGDSRVKGGGEGEREIRQCVKSSVHWTPSDLFEYAIQTGT